MIVIRNVDSTGSECDQKIYCNIACFDHEINWTDSGNPHDSNGSDPHETLKWFAELEQFTVYENEHIIPNSHYPTIEDFISEDFKEYCNSCQIELN
jgi:hypothetical protein|tara:strand:- start:209 stop:496 length:288 start_codon:yes stop_codon:yes gene_type:complete